MYDVDFGAVNFKFPMPSSLLGIPFPKAEGKPSLMFYYFGMYWVAPIHCLSANNTTNIRFCSALQRVAMDADILCRSAIFTFEPHDSAAIGLVSQSLDS